MVNLQWQLGNERGDGLKRKVLLAVEGEYMQDIHVQFNYWHIYATESKWQDKQTTMHLWPLKNVTGELNSKYVERLSWETKW